jgi:transcription initiation factor TFIID subunit TAF12
MTCLALLSSNIQSWEDAIDAFVQQQQQQHQQQQQQQWQNNNINDEKISNDSPDYLVIASHVRRVMERVVNNRNNPVDQTFRVAQHSRLGMDRAPILLTATRIK